MTLADKIYEFGNDAMNRRIDEKTMEEIKKRVVDSIFVSYGARKAEPVKIALETLLPSKGKLNSVVYFYNRKGAVDVVTFLNGCMTRYLDYNDTYLSREALHPSDNIPPIIAYAHAKEMDGESAIKAVNVAYQVVGALADAVSIRDRGWDHVTYISISSAAGLAALNNFDNKKFVNTLNLAINNNISLRQTRAGELSMWKGCTAANASRNSVFAAMLAEHGFTGPGPIFEGEMGFFKQVSGEFDLNFDENRVLRTMIKNYPVEYHAMSAVDAALRLHNKMKGNRIESIDVKTFSVAYKIIVKDPEKLRPKTRETADHSLPYIIAYTLAYGEPNLTSYNKDKLEDRKILDLIDRMRVDVDPEYDKMYPEYLPVKISVITDLGKYTKEVTVPKGHFRAPYDWDDLLNKGTRIMGDEDDAREILNAGKKLDKIYVKEFLDVINNVKVKR